MGNLANTFTEGKTINLAIHRDLETGRWFLDQIEVRCSDVRSVTRFTQKTTLEQALSAELFQLLKDHLPTNLSQQVRSISGEVFNLTTVVLDDLRVLAQSAANGIQRVIIRFNKAFGQVYAILSAGHRPDHGMISAPMDPTPAIGREQNGRTVPQGQRHDNELDPMGLQKFQTALSRR